MCKAIIFWINFIVYKWTILQAKCRELKVMWDRFFLTDVGKIKSFFLVLRLPFQIWKSFKKCSVWKGLRIPLLKLPTFHWFFSILNSFLFWLDKCLFKRSVHSTIFQVFQILAKWVVFAFLWYSCNLLKNQNWSSIKD